MRKHYILLATLLVMTFFFYGCAKAKYKEDDVIGLTSSEIVEKYGDFNRKQGTPDESGAYRNCGCGYLIASAKKGFFGTEPPEYFMIYFDEDGVAYWCRYEQVV